MKTLFKKYYYWLTPILFFLSFPSFDCFIFKFFPFFAWFSLVPIFIYIKKINMKNVYIVLFLTGFLANFLTYFWVGVFGAAGVKDITVLFTSGFWIVTIVFVSALTVVLSVKIFIAEYLSRKYEFLRFFIFPAIWLLFDWFQSFGTLAFPWTYWGYSQYPVTAIIQSTSLFGVLGLSFFMIMFNRVLADLIEFVFLKKNSVKQNLKEAVILKFIITLSVVVLLFIFGTIKLLKNSESKKNEFSVAVAQSCISPWEGWGLHRYNYLGELIKLTKEAVKQKPDFVIWSESATLENISGDYSNNRLNMFEDYMLNYISQTKIPFLSGEIRRVSGGYQNSAVLIDGDGKVKDFYAKINLVPFGEWFPYQKLFPKIDNMLKSFGASSFIPGKELRLFEIKNRHFAPLICYEGIFFKLCRRYKNMGADFFVNITNDGWTNNFSGHMQHFSASVFRSVENGIWLVRSGNTGKTAVIDPYGRVTSSIPILKKDFLVGTMDFSMNYKTIYSIYGDWFSALILFIMIILCFHFIFNFIKEEIKNKI